MFPPRLNDATVHGAKVCAVRVAYESDANIYGVRRQAQRDAALDGVPLLKFAGKARKRGKAASRFACRRTPWQRLVLYLRNTSQSGVALRLPPHSMAEAGFVPQKHKPKRRRAALAALAAALHRA